MAPKFRKKDKHLPPNVYFKDNAYYYVALISKKRKWIHLGYSFSESMKKWSEIINKPKRIFTMGQLFDRYIIEIAPSKSPASYKQNLIQMKHLRLFFDELSPDEVNAVHIYEYLDIRSQKSKVAPNREKALLSHVFSTAIRWGVVKDNPCRNVKRLTERPRDRYITDEEYKAVRSIANPTLQCLMDFAYLTGQRIGDILKIKLSDMNDDGIKIQQSKTGKKLFIEWSPTLKEVISRVKSLPRSKIVSLTLFCNRRGLKMTYDSFKSIWQKTIKEALDKKLIETSFHFHDIRGKSASDAKNKYEVSELLGHTDIKITQRTYIRNANKVKPIK